MDRYIPYTYIHSIRRFSYLSYMHAYKMMKPKSNVMSRISISLPNDNAVIQQTFLQTKKLPSNSLYNMELFIQYKY